MMLPYYSESIISRMHEKKLLTIEEKNHPGLSDENYSGTLRLSQFFVFEKFQRISLNSSRDIYAEYNLTEKL